MVFEKPDATKVPIEDLVKIRRQETFSRYTKIVNDIEQRIVNILKERYEYLREHGVLEEGCINLTRLALYEHLEYYREMKELSQDLEEALKGYIELVRAQLEKYVKLGVWIQGAMAVLGTEAIHQLISGRPDIAIGLGVATFTTYIIWRWVIPHAMRVPILYLLFQVKKRLRGSS